ncbi:FAD binding domain protein [Nemania serpens]|nr:FAD binding domain protein [Nemania serpens]
MISTAPLAGFAALLATLPLSAASSVLKWTPNIPQIFRGHLSSGAEIFLPSDPGYTNATTQRWTVYDEPTYAASIVPATASDVQTIVTIAGRYGIPFLATGGGHGLSITLANVHNGIEIDLSKFKNVTVDTIANTVTVGGANVFGDVFAPVWSAGKEMTTGSCACPGVVGASITGGVGRLQGLHGLIIDNLLSVELVTANGSLLTVSETENADLFFGIRGGAANFGIILWATYKIYDHTNRGYVFNADFIVPANESHNHFETLKRVAANMPAELAMISDVNYNTQYGGLNILFNAVFYGSEAEGRKLVEPFTLNNPIVANYSYVLAQDLTTTALFGLFADAQCVKGKHINTYTVGATGVDVPTWDAHVADLTQLYKKYPQVQQSTVLLETFSSVGVLAADGSKTSVPQKHREITNYVLWGYNYDDTSIDRHINKFAASARKAFTATSGFSDLELYTTYAHGDEGPQVWYREQLPALQKLKKQWDPQNLFGFMNPVPV